VLDLHEPPLGALEVPVISGEACEVFGTAKEAEQDANAIEKK